MDLQTTKSAGITNAPRILRGDSFISAVCRRSYYEFFREMWSVVVPEKLSDAWYIRKICDHLQQLAELVFASKPKNHDLILNQPPGTSKSSLVSIFFQPWVWTRMPSARFISGSYSERLAIDLSRKSRDVVMSEKYQKLFPEVKLRDDQNTKTYFMNKAGGMRYAVGVGGSVIGMHAHFLLIDDPCDPQAVLSDLILADINAWITETLSRRVVNSEVVPMAIIQQRLHQGDPTGIRLEKKAPVFHVCLPGEDAWDIKPEEYRQYYQDGLMDPVRLSRPVLEEIRETLGEFAYAGQIGQSPIPRGGAMFKVENLQYSQELPTRWKRGPHRFWDKAATQDGGAYTAGVKMAVDMQDRVWILDVVRGQWDSGRREMRMLITAKADGYRCRQDVEQEPAGSGKESAEATVKRMTLAGYRSSAIKLTGDKELRADPLSEQVNLGNVILYSSKTNPEPWVKPFVEEMRFFPRSKFKDQIDAAGGCFYTLRKKRLLVGRLGSQPSGSSSILNRIRQSP